MKKFNIYKFKPCLDATKYYDACKSSEEAWNNCSRGDWMLWITSNLEVDIKILTLAKVHCALTVKHLMKDKRSIEALEVALKFVNGKATLKELKIADSAAHVAAHINYANAAHTAAYACANAANAAYAAAYINYTHAANVADDACANAANAAAYAADVANAVAYATTNTTAYAAANAAAYAADAIYADYAYTAYTDIYTVADAAKIKNQLKTANICRKYLTKYVFKILSFYNNEKIQYKSI